MLKPGYKQTDIGVLPEEQFLGNLFWEKPIKAPINDPIETVSFIGMEDVSEKGELEEAHQLPYNQVKKGLTYFEKDDVLVAKITPCFENGKGAYLGNLDTNRGFGSTEFHVLRAKPNADARYIFYHTQSAKFRLELAGEMVGSAGHRRVPLTAIKNYVLPFAHSYAEQQAIADTLGAVDALLREQRALLAKKRDLKLATQTALLTRARRLPGFTDEWQENRLEEVAQIDPENLSSSTNSAYRFKYVALEGVSKGQLTGWNYFTYATAPSRARRIVRKNDILVGTVRPNLLNHYYQSEEVKDLICSTGFAVVRCNTEKADARFIFQHLFFDAINQQIEAVIGGSNYPAISSRDVRALNILLPQPNEQKAIADILTDMDTELAALAAQLAKTEALKQGLMQDLLTGTIRLRGAAPLSPTQ